MLPTLRHADSYRINFSNNLSFEEINESNASNTSELTAGWLCLAIAKYVDGTRYSGIPNALMTGVDLFSEIVQEDDGSITANPFLLSNEVLENIKVGYAVTTKDKSFPENHLADKSYSRFHYGAKVNMPLSDDAELMVDFMQPLDSSNFDNDSTSQYTIEEVYEHFIQRVSTMKLFNTHWGSLVVSAKSLSLTGKLTKDYLDKKRLNTGRQLRIREYHDHIFGMVSERHVFEVESNSEDNLKNISLTDFKTLFTNEVDASQVLREKYFPTITENSNKKDVLLEEVEHFERSI